MFRCDKLDRYLMDRSITDPTDREIADHLTGCRACRKEWERLDRIRLMLSDDVSHSHRPHSSAAPFAVMSRLRTGGTVSPSEGIVAGQSLRRRLVPGFAAAMAGALTVAGVVMTGGLYRLGSPPARTAIADGSVARVSRKTLRLPHLKLRSAAPHVAAPHLDGKPLSPGSMGAPDRPACGPAGNGVSPRPSVIVNGVARLPAHQGDHVSALQSGRAPMRRSPAHPSPSKAQRPASRPATGAADDLAYLNAAPPQPRLAVAAKAVEGQMAKGDDFVTIPPPRIAANDSPETDRLVADAVKRYGEEKAVVDERLFQKISVEMPAGDLGTLAKLLAAKTGVSFEVSHDIEDWKLTVLVKDVPARDLMRQIVRLFNLEWQRHGDEGHYRYVLAQTLKQKLEEEEMKRKDDDEIVLNAVDDLEKHRDLLDADPEVLKRQAADLRERARTAGSVEERARLQELDRIYEILSSPLGRDAFRLFYRLTPDQIVQLRNGSRIHFVSDGTRQEIDPETIKRLQSQFAGGGRLDASPPGSAYVPKLDGVPISEMTPENTYAEGRIQLDQEWPGRAVVKAELLFAHRTGSAQGQGFGLPTILTTAEPEHLRSPDNARAHESLRADARYTAPVSLDPRPDDPLKISGDPMLNRLLQMTRYTAATNFTTVDDPAPAAFDSNDWVDSGDVFTDLHKATGRNIIADYYLHIYPRSQFDYKERKLLDALNGIADGLQSEWDDDGGFLRFRRMNYYAERAMEIPNRLLAKWKADRKANGHASLDSLAEMAAQPEALFTDNDFQRAIYLKYGITEWSYLSYAKDFLRLYGSLAPPQRQAAQSDEGVRYTSFTPEQAAIVRDTWLKGVDTATSSGRFFIRVRPAGDYIWKPSDPAAARPILPGTEPVRAKTRQEAETAAAAYVQQNPTVPRRFKDQPIAMEVDGPGPGLWIGLWMGMGYANVDYWVQ